MSDDLVVTLPVKQFMLMEHCPPEWRRLDLYLFRDDALAFYVGQSYVAFDRVWEHIRHGFRGRSVIGRFILCNWPKSLNYQIDLLSSQASQFAPLQHNLNMAEAELIQRWSPCFNQALNHQPTPLPDRYILPSAPLRCSHSLTKLMREAERAVKAEDRRRWLTVVEQ
ncbi:MAG: hypothetical protein IPL78_18510 [Chloroflexi bacterium]|nr:hypothetical protein [Chloroflexota bacterium]